VAGRLPELLLRRIADPHVNDPGAEPTPPVNESDRPEIAGEGTEFTSDAIAGTLGQAFEPPDRPGPGE
jgi:hypothetical protein